MEREVKVKNPHGLHARPAALFVRKAATFPCKLTVFKGERSVDAKSIMGVLSLGIEPNETIRVIADGDCAEKAIEALVAIAENEEL